MQQMLCEKIAYLKLMTAKTELTMARGERIDEDVYLNAINCLSGLLSKIGLKRRAKTLSLKDYLSQQPAPIEGATTGHEPTIGKDTDNGNSNTNQSRS